MVKVEAVIRFGRATHAPLARPVRVTSAEEPGQHVESLDSKPPLAAVDEQSAAGRVVRKARPPLQVPHRVGGNGLPGFDFDGDEPVAQLYIHPEECIDCAACEPVCPVTAIFAEDDTPTEWDSYIDLNYEYFGISR